MIGGDALGSQAVASASMRRTLSTFNGPALTEDPATEAARRARTLTPRRP